MANVENGSLLLNGIGARRAGFRPCRGDSTVQQQRPGSARASGIGATGSIPGTSLTLGLAKAPDEIEAEWRHLETCAPFSPYQRFDLCAAWARHAAPGAGIEIKIGVVRDESASVVAILPFGISRRLGVAAAVYLGGAHFNMNMPLADAKLAFDAKTAGAVLDAYAEAAGADVLALHNQPEAWLGRPHLFAAVPHDLAPDDVRVVEVAGSYDEYLKTQLTRKMRSELRRKGLKFNEAGPTAMHRAHTVEEIDRLLHIFVEQKSKRLASQGRGDPFVLPGVREFLREALLAGLDGRGGMEIHWMTVDGRVTSIRGGVRHGAQLSFMVQSFDTSDPIAKYSPSEFLLNELMAGAHAEGVNAFDFGVGDGRFKQAWSNGLVPLFNITRAATNKGRLYASVMRLERAVIRTIKRNPSLFGAVQDARASLARFRGVA